MLITEENFSGVVCRDSGFVQQKVPADRKKPRLLNLGVHGDWRRD